MSGFIYLVLLICATVCDKHIHAVAEVRVPPLILSPDSPSSTYYTSGSRVVLHCHATGHPTPTYTWLRVTDSLTANLSTVQSVPGLVSVDHATGDLVLEHVTEDVQGRFVCAAAVRFLDDVTAVSEPDGITGFKGHDGVTAVSWSPVQSVFVRRLENFRHSTAPTLVVKRPVFAHARLECSDRGVVAGGDVDWTWYRFSDTGLSVVSLDDGRLFVDLDGSLHFTYLLPNDSSEHSGQYLCGVSMAAMGVTKLGHPLTLEVELSGESQGKAPSLAYSSATQTVHVDKMAALECVFEGIDPLDPQQPQIDWLDSRGHYITSSGRYNISSGGRRLEIDDVAEDDEGRYFCQGRNSLGISGWAPLSLDVTSTPSWLSGGRPEDRTMSHDQEEMFSCRTRSAAGEVRPQRPVWFINGLALDKWTSVVQWRLSSDRSFMMVQGVTSPLCVQCVVTNLEGQILGNACLHLTNQNETQSGPTSTTTSNTSQRKVTTNPADPVETADPADPAEPALPSDPILPADPTLPADPADPADPAVYLAMAKGEGGNKASTMGEEEASSSSSAVFGIVAGGVVAVVVTLLVVVVVVRTRRKSPRI